MSGPPLLIVDDSPEDQELLIDLISEGEHAYICHTAATGEEALTLYNSASPICVLLDYRLETENGLDLLPVFRQADPVGPVIILTGQGSEQIAASAIKNGAADYIVKQDITGFGLRTAIENAIARAQLERKVIAQQQELQRKGRLDALGQLSAGIAHDFNNTLASIQLAVGSVLKENLSDNARKKLDMSLTLIDRAAKTSASLLGFASKQTGRVTAHACQPVLTELEALSKDVIETTCSIGFHPVDSEALVYCDHALLQNALLNLVLNARDAVEASGREGQIDVMARQLAAENVGTDGDVVEFVVTDNGIGMSPEVLEKSTDPYFTSKEASGGTGLGLSMAHGFTNQSGGSMHIESALGIGTTVRLRVPVGHRDQIAETQPRPPTPQTSLQKLQVLVVDDQAMLRTLLADELKEAGYVVSTAASGREALEHVQRAGCPDAVVTDITMPGELDGFQLASELRTSYPEAYIIGISGYHRFDEKRDLSAINEILVKPFDPQDLISRLETRNSH